MKRTEQARDTLRLATQFEGEDAQHCTMLSTLELEAGHAQVARRVLMEGAEKYPGDYFMLQRWGSMEAKLGNTEKARELFERSARIQPHAPTFVAWAILEEELGTRAVEAEASRAAGGVKMEELDSSLLDLPAVRDPAVAEMLGELSDLPMVDLGEGEGEGGGVNTDAEDRMGHPSLSQDPAHFAPGTPGDQAEDAVEFASKQLIEHLLSLGMVVDPQHGPLYHAYGNMELRHAT